MTGRFLSADPYVTDPMYTQNYNRYSYVYNNPLSFTDPSGFDGEPCPAGALTNIGIEVIPLFNEHGDRTGYGYYQVVGRFASAYRCTPTVLMQDPGRSPNDSGSYLYNQGLHSAQGQNSSLSTEVGMSADALAIYAGMGEYSNVFDGKWRGANGKWYRLAWGGNKGAGARSVALANARFLKAVTKGAFVVSAGVGVLDGIDAAERGDGFGVATAASNVSWAAAGTFGGPIGWAGAATYTLTSWALKLPDVYKVVITTPLDIICARSSGC